MMIYNRHTHLFGAFQKIFTPFPNISIFPLNINIEILKYVISEFYGIMFLKLNGMELCVQYYIYQCHKLIIRSNLYDDGRKITLCIS